MVVSLEVTQIFYDVFVNICNKYMQINRININRYLIIEATMSFDTW